MRQLCSYWFRLYLVVVLAVLSCLSPSNTRAQITFDGCVDAYGRPVFSSNYDALQDVAAANLAPNGSPIILYNRNVLMWMAPETRLFWYGHECGHHALGHLLGSGHPLSREQEADCFGIVTLVKEGLIDIDDVPKVQADLARLGPGDWTHLPGPQRAINLAACLEHGGGDDQSTRWKSVSHTLEFSGYTELSYPSRSMACQAAKQMVERDILTDGCKDFFDDPDQYRNVQAGSMRGSCDCEGDRFFGWNCTIDANVTCRAEERVER